MNLVARHAYVEGATIRTRKISGKEKIFQIEASEEVVIQKGMS